MIMTDIHFQTTYVGGILLPMHKVTRGYFMIQVLGAQVVFMMQVLYAQVVFYDLGTRYLGGEVLDAQVVLYDIGTRYLGGVYDVGTRCIGGIL